MQKIIAIGLSSILLLSLFSCEEPDGKWDDNIKLSEKEVSLSAEPNTVVITTGGTGWWIDGIGLDDNWNYDFSDIDTTKDNFMIEEDEFIIERKNTNEIHISMTENQSSFERVLTIGLQAGNYFDSIKIIQSSR